MELKRVPLLVVILVTLEGWWCCDGCLEHERNALLRIKTSFNDPYSLISWVKHSNCCSWDGIECNANTGRVIVIDIFDSRDTDLGYWYLNASLFLPFEELKYLSLESNRIIGCIENEGFGRLSRLSHLEQLDLYDNNFSNNILSSLGYLSSLKSLFLDYNNLKGMINIEELNNLSKLEELGIGGNELEGFQSFQDIKNLSNLNTLYLDDLNINGTSLLLQQSLRMFPNLKIMSLDGNNFKGTTLPQEFRKDLMNLEKLYLRGSSMDENFFLSLGALVSLKTLDLSSVRGTIPIEGLINLHKLETLDLSSNQNWDNRMLQKIGKISSLKVLYLLGCGLNDTLSTIGGLCALKHLQELDISYNNLGGNLPWCLANLTSLQILDLRNNFFTDNISLSPLKSLTFIEELRIGGNHFKIPFSLGPFFNHSKLKYFWGSSNEIFADTEAHNLIPKFQLNELELCGHGYGGPFSKFLYHQHNLTYVEFCDFEIVGEFPYWLLDNNTGLALLSLVNTSLSGPLQLPIHHHPQLQLLDISNNRFNSQVPAKIGAYFPRLFFVNISANDFRGRIPSSYGNISTLKWLYMNNNQFTGGIPDSLSKCSYLTILDVSNNNLSRTGWMGNMSSLEVLDLSNNLIFGSLPSRFGPPKIKEVHLFNNGLRGVFPLAFFNCAELTILDISLNNFTGSIPRWIDRFSQLYFLLLSHNNFKGELPIELCNLNALRFTDLSHNDFSGPILPCLRSSDGSNSLAHKQHAGRHVRYFAGIYMVDGANTFSMQPVELTTKSMSYFYHGLILNLIYGIDLSCNNFIGEIAQEIGNLVEIQFLNLSHNSLRGPIPPTLSKLSQILSLDLSYNKLTGAIPSEFSQLHSLEVFSVAYNNLHGRTPGTVAQFATFDESSYKGNPLLCGPPLPNSCIVAVPSSSLQPSSDESSGFMDINAFYVTFVVTYIIVLLGMAAILFINPHWRKAWFYFIEVSINNCYYFVVDNFPVPSKFRLFQPL